jgi:F-box protein 7
MRLRVRLAGVAGGETHRVATPEVCSVATLRSLVAARLGLPPDAVRLSLNGADELAPGAAGGLTLQAAGIAPGDLILVLQPATAADGAAAPGAASGAPAAPALAPLTWQQPGRASWAPAQGGAVPAQPQPPRGAQPAQPASAEARRAACLRALEARGAAGVPAVGAEAAQRDGGATHATAAAPPAADDDAMDASPAASDALAPPSSVPGASRGPYRTLQRPPCQPYSLGANSLLSSLSCCADALREVLSSCAWHAPAEALALLLHAAMLESGFSACGNDDIGISLGRAPPAGWREAPGRYAFRYVFAGVAGDVSSAPSAWLRCRSLGGALVAYGALEAAQGASPPPAVHRLALPLAAGAPASLVYPRAAWAAAKDALASRLLAAACEAAGLPPPPALTALPDALKRALLSALPAEALAAVGATCRDLRYVAADEDLWRRLYESQFGAAGAPGAAAGAAALAARRGWRAAFAAAAAERSRQTRRDAMAADMRRRRPRPHVFPAIPGAPPGFPGAFPGIIGGDYDLHPGGGFGRGGLGGGGFGGGGGGFGFGLMQPPGGPMGRGAMGGLPRPHHFQNDDEEFM